MQQDGKRYGYYNDYGEYVDLCMSNGYTDNDGREYDFTCEEYQSKMMTCSDGHLCDYCEYEVDQTYMPCDEYVCKDYYTYCSDLYEPNYKTMYNDENGQQQYNQYQQTYQQVYNNGGGGNGYKYYDYDYNQQQEENELYQFLECTEYVNEYGQQYFVGPHCASDHYTISLGVFSDENCVDYLGETISLSKVLGYGYDDESFFHLPHECISCDGAVSKMTWHIILYISCNLCIYNFDYQSIVLIFLIYIYICSNNFRKMTSDTMKCTWDKVFTENTLKHQTKSLMMLLLCAQLSLNEARNVTFT